MDDKDKLALEGLKMVLHDYKENVLRELLESFDKGDNYLEKFKNHGFNLNGADDQKIYIRAIREVLNEKKIKE